RARSGAAAGPGIPARAATLRLCRRSARQIQRRGPWIGLVPAPKRSQDIASVDCRQHQSRFRGNRASRQPERILIKENSMRSKLTLSLAASAAVMLFHPAAQTVWAQGQAALTGTVSSDAEGNMEGVVVTANKPDSIVQVSVTTDAQGRYAFPESRL